MTLDPFDIRLLAALQADGRLTNIELAGKVGLSASQCSRRRSALEASGAIASYSALLSPEALKLAVTAFVQVTLSAHSPQNSKRFQMLLDTLDEVQEAYSLTGEADYLVKMRVTDLAALARVFNEVLLPHGTIARVRSSIVLERLKETPRLPLRHLSSKSRQVARKR